MDLETARRKLKWLLHGKTSRMKKKAFDAFRLFRTPLVVENFLSSFQKTDLFVVLIRL